MIVQFWWFQNTSVCKSMWHALNMDKDPLGTLTTGHLHETGRRTQWRAPDFFRVQGSSDYWRTNRQGTGTWSLMAIKPDKVLLQILYIIQMPGLLLSAPSSSEPHPDFVRIEVGCRNKRSKVEMTKKETVLPLLNPICHPTFVSMTSCSPPPP